MKILIFKFLFAVLVPRMINAAASGAPWKVVSLLEICQPKKMNDAAENPTQHDEINHIALAIHYGIMYGLDENFQKQIDYKKYDVCNDTNALVRILLELIVDKNNVGRHGNNNQNKNGVVPADGTRILCVLTYLSRERTILVANILSSTRIPVISFQNHSLLGGVYNPNFLEHGELMQETNKYLLSFLKRHHYDYFVVFSLNESYGTHDRYLNFVNLAQKSVCLTHQTTSLNDAYNQAMAVKNKRAYVFVIFGDILNVSVMTLSMQMNLDDKKEPIPLIYPVWEIEKSGPFHGNATQKLLELLDDSNKDGDYHNQTIKVGEYKGSHILIRFATFFNDLKMRKNSIDKLNGSDVLATFDMTLYLNRSMKSNCTAFKCQAGFERRLVKAPDTPPNKEQFDFKCLRCPQNHVKDSFSENKCVRCVGKNISNAARIRCYVPYKLRTFNYKNIGSVTGLVVNTIGIVLSALTVLLFEIYKKTPIVRASDRTLSQIQLTLSFLLFTLLLIQAMVQPPIVASCVAFPSMIGICFSAFVAVTLAKVEKPLLVFKHRKHLTQRDINTTIAHQFFIIGMIPIASVLLAVVQYKYKPTYIRVTLNDVIVEKSLSCSNDGHLHIQIVFIILLSLITLIQAYRSRQLPDNYSESMTILYSSLSAAVFLAILFPLYHFQTTDLGRSNVQWIALSSVALMLLVALYAHKLYIMLICPEKNTMKAWNKRRIQYSMEESTSYNQPLTVTESEAFV